MGGTMIVRAPLQVQETKTKEGFTRAIAIVPKQIQVLYLGVALPSNEISLWGLCPMRPKDAKGVPKPFAPEELGHLDFVSAIEGQDVPDIYKFRATVPTPGGILFLFEAKPSSIIVPGGIG